MSTETETEINTETKAKRGRKPLATHAALATGQEIVPADPRQIDVEEQIAAQQHSGAAQAERDTANQLLGQIQMARAFSDFANVISLEKLRVIKETKQYKALAGLDVKTQDGKTANVSTWEGFLQTIGLDRAKVDEDLLNLRIFGERALENLSRVGAGYRELRKLRKLPEDDRKAIVGQVEMDLGDKDSILQLIDDMSVKHAKEKAALEKKVAALETDQAAVDKVLADKERKIRELHVKVEASQRQAATPDEKIAAWTGQIEETLGGLQYASVPSLGSLRVLLQQIWQDYDGDGGEPPRQLRQAIGAGIQRLRADVEALAEEFQLWDAMGEVINAGQPQWTPGESEAAQTH